MKNKILIAGLFTFLFVVGKAQEEVTYPGGLNSSENYTSDPRLYLSNLTQEKIGYEVLIDRTIFTNKILEVNGISKVTTINYAEWKHCYHQLKYSHQDTAYFPSLNLLEQASASSRVLDNTVVIGLFNVNFKQIKDSALVAGDFIEVSQKLYDYKATESSYSTEKAFGVTVFAENVNGNSINFSLPESFYLSNDSTSNVLSTEIDFGNGEGYQSIDYDDVKSVYYSGAGGYVEIKVKQVLENNSTLEQITLYAHASVYRKNTAHIPSISNDDARKRTTGGDSKHYGEYFPELSSIEVFGGKTNSFQFSKLDHSAIQVTYLINSKNNSGKLRRPLVVVDGFDHGNIRDFNSTTKESGLYYDNDFRGLFELMNGDPSKWDEGTPVSSSTSANLIPALQNLGFDIIFVNWLDGSGDVNDNAKLFRRFLNEVLNSDKYRDNKTEEIVVVGPSMGGLITRMALTEMEKANEDHCVKTWISFDSPHNGANIPMTLQESVISGTRWSFGASNFTPKKETLDSKAARQLFLDHYSQYSFKNGASAERKYDNTPESKSLYKKLEDLGYPQISKNYAITNGGITKLYEDGGKTLDFKIYGFREKVFGVPLLIGPVSSVITTATMEGWDINNVGENGSLLFSGYNITNTPKTIPVWVYNKTSYARAPGGWHPGMYSVNFNESSVLRSNHNLSHIPTKWSCFIPTASAFGMLGNTLQERSENIYRTHKEFTNINDYDSGKIRTPFDGVFGMRDNEEHVKITSFTRDQVEKEWLKQDLIKTVVPVQRVGVNTKKIISKPRAFVLKENIEFAGMTNSVVIKKGSEVNVVAGKSIKFSAGFSVNKGATLSAKIENRNYSPLRKKKATSKIYVNNNTGGKSSYKGEVHDYMEENDKLELQQDSVSVLRVEVYPNPVGERLNFTVEGVFIGDLVTATIYSEMGQVVFQKGITYSGQNFIRMAHLNPGVYQLKLTTNLRTKTIQIIKK